MGVRRVPRSSVEAGQGVLREMRVVMDRGTGRELGRYLAVRRSRRMPHRARGRIRVASEGARQIGVGSRGRPRRVERFGRERSPKPDDVGRRDRQRV